MIISEDLLVAYGAEYETYKPGHVIFHEDTAPRFYFQIVSGTVELNNYHEDGKEFTQSILTDGKSLGESFLFSDRRYPTNATAKTDCKILKLHKTDFYNLIQNKPEELINIVRALSESLHNKYVMMYSISSSDPSFKINSLMNYLKGDGNTAKFSFKVPLTRKQLAHLTGLRVETVIRTVKKLHNNNILKIKNGKIFY